MATIAVAPTRSRNVDLALAVLRIVLGAVFVAHGAQKIFVYGFGGVTGAFTQMGAPAPGITGPLTACVEFLGGLALVFGLLTRLAALGIACVMIGAILLVHLKQGFFAPGGFEYPLTLLAAAITLMIAGAGDYSLDALISRRRTSSGPRL